MIKIYGKINIKSYKKYIIKKYKIKFIIGIILLLVQKGKKIKRQI